MAWYPGAVKMELQPESDAQPAIRPTQMIVHSIVAPWTPRRTYEYWQNSNLESHFGLGYDGDIAQYIGTETRADANAGANRRADGTGAVSIETASNTSASDPWTAAQVEELIKLGAWLHQHHGIPLRMCRTHSDPGFGYHRLFPQWSTSGTACPGNARVRQFREVVFPGIVARTAGQTTTPEENDMPTAAEVAAEVIKLLLDTDGTYDAPKDASDYDPDPNQPGHYWTGRTVYRDLVTRIRRTDRAVAELDTKVEAVALALSKIDPAALAAAVAASVGGYELALVKKENPS